MTRESRNNLIFLAILLALLTPGAVILFRKKLQPTLRPMSEPDPVPRTIAYMSPQETPPGMTRVEPPHLAEWKATLLPASSRERGVRPRDARGLPLMSQKKTFEVLCVESQSVWVILWNAPPDGTPAWETGGVEHSESVAIPSLVRDELGEAGVLAPPKTVIVQSIRFQGGLPKKLALRRGDEIIDSADIVQSFTNHAPTGN